MRSTEFSADVAVTAVANVFQAILSFVTGIMVARLLGPQGRGELVAIQSWGSLIASLASHGFHESAVYFSARHPEEGKRYWVSATIAGLLISAPFIPVGYWILPRVMPAQSPDVITTAQIYFVVLTPLFAVYGIPLDVLRGCRNFLSWNALQSLPLVCWFLLLGFGILVGHATPASLAFGYLAVHGFLFIIVASLASKKLKGRFLLDIKLWLPMVRYGFPLMAAALPAYLTQTGRITQLIMLAFLDSESTGLFTVAMTYGSVTMMLSHIIGTVTFPYMASVSTDEKKQLLIAWLPVAALLSSIASVVLLLVTPLLVPLLFGHSFEAAVPAAAVMTLCGLLASLARVFEEALRGLGRTGCILLGQSISFTVQVVCAAVLIKPFAVFGGSIAVSTGFLFLCSYYLLVLARCSRITARELIIPKIGAIGYLTRQFRVLLRGS